VGAPARLRTKARTHRPRAHLRAPRTHDARKRPYAHAYKGSHTHPHARARARAQRARTHGASVRPTCPGPNTSCTRRMTNCSLPPIAAAAAYHQPQQHPGRAFCSVQRCTTHDPPYDRGKPMKCSTHRANILPASRRATGGTERGNRQQPHKSRARSAWRHPKPQLQRRRDHRARQHRHQPVVLRSACHAPRLRRRMPSACRRGFSGGRSRVAHPCSHTRRWLR
jgi:hypothetical protein